MVKRLEFYRCQICGNIIQVMHEGAGELVCCEQAMDLLEAKTHEEGLQEKHVPYYISENEIQIGSAVHPMTAEHHIEFIQIISDDKKQVQTQFLDIEQPPLMQIKTCSQPQKAYEYCNLHGLWSN